MGGRRPLLREGRSSDWIDENDSKIALRYHKRSPTTAISRSSFAGSVATCVRDLNIAGQHDFPDGYSFSWAQDVW